MDAGADTTVEISSGENPLYIAAQMGHIEIVKLILSKVKILDKTESDAIGLWLEHFSSVLLLFCTFCAF